MALASGSLEAAARRFNQIDPAHHRAIVDRHGPRLHLRHADPSRHELRGLTSANPSGSRIVNLSKGTAVSPSAEFIVATNNYRASGGGNFPGLDGSKTIFASCRHQSRSADQLRESREDA